MAEIFGYDSEHTGVINATTGNMWRGGVEFSPEFDGVLDSMSFYGKANESGCKFRAALYDNADDTFVGATVESPDEVPTSYGWCTADADGIVNVFAAKSYQLVIEFSSGGGTHFLGGVDVDPLDSYYDPEAYGGTWPSPASWITSNTYKYCIYATYTPSGAEQSELDYERKTRGVCRGVGRGVA
jgi:hypothetical protein